MKDSNGNSYSHYSEEKYKSNFMLIISSNVSQIARTNKFPQATRGKMKTENLTMIFLQCF